MKVDCQLLHAPGIEPQPHAALSADVYPNPVFSAYELPAYDCRDVLQTLQAIHLARIDKGV